MKIKVCGITRLEQLKRLETLGADYAGMIFFPSSPRYMLRKLRSNEVMQAGTNIKKVGVFVNALEDDVMSQIELYGLDLVQLHGFETPTFCRHIRKVVPVIKAFRINKLNENNIDWMVKPFEDVCDHYLFDYKQEGMFGGTGEKFNWDVLKSSEINKPFFLGGGIGIDDVEIVRAFKHPHFHAIDINSRFESEPGVKKMEEIEKFIKSVKQTG